MSEPIDTTELRRIVGAMTPGLAEYVKSSGGHDVVIDEGGPWVVVSRSRNESNARGILYFKNNALALADEIDRLRAELTAEQERSEKRAEALRYAVEQYGKPGGPWSVPSDPGGWLSRAREALEMQKEGKHE